MVLNNPHLGEPNDRCIPVLPIYRTPANLPTEQLNYGRQVAKQGVQGSRRNDQGQEDRIRLNPVITVINEQDSSRYHHYQIAAEKPTKSGPKKRLKEDYDWWDCSDID